MDFTEKTTATRMIYSGRVVNLRVDDVTLPNGKPGTREVVEHPGGVAVVALDEENNLLMVSQYRYAMAQELLEIPAGKLEYGEDPAACGLRELEEETGYTAAEYRLLCRTIPTPGYDTEVIHIYFARGLTKTQQNLDEGEFLTVQRVPFQTALERVLSGELTDAKTQLGILQAAVLQSRGAL